MGNYFFKRKYNMFDLLCFSAGIHLLVTQRPVPAVILLVVSIAVSVIGEKYLTKK